MSYLSTSYIKNLISNWYSTSVVRIFFLLLISCSPKVYYLGETYPITNDIDIFYDEKDIGREYQTIGQMTHDKILNYSAEEIKKEMIVSAKKRGADGIVFTDLVMERENDLQGDRLSIKAKLIKYINQ